jgi:signal transduction histidine kinase/ligand-binding sensor domain-containing protein/DNA-binding response OmpR family regulator
MWFGTMSGLNRYDGYNFKIFRHSLNDSTTISDNFIVRIVEDDENRLWISTRNGINIYDPKTETFSRDLNTYLKKFGITSASFSSLVKDRSGNVWIINSMSGLYKHEAASGKFIRINHNPSDTTSIYSNDISTIAEDYNGDYWVLNRLGILEKIDGKTCKVIYRNYALHKEYPGELMDFGIFIDTDNDLWIFLPGDAKGLYYFNTSKKSLLHITKDSPKCKLNTNLVRNIVQDEHGMVWIGTDHGGINLLDKKDFTIRYLLNNPDDEKSISQNSIVSMYKDNLGIIWIGTYKKGINYYHENLIKFQLVRHKSSNANSLGFDDVNCFDEDSKGNLWIGTNGGGLIYDDRKQNRFASYIHQSGNPNSLSNDIIVSLYTDKQQKLWIGTYFGGLDVFDGKRFRTFRHDPSNPQSLSDDRVWRIYEDSRNNLWIGTLGGGLDLFDRQKEIFYHYRANDVNSVRSAFVICFQEDDDKNLWIGTADGIDILQRQTGRFMHLAHEDNNLQSLSNNNVTAILEDSRKWMWVATREGLNLYDKGKGTFRVFREENGLPDDAILSVLEDNNKNLWVSTPRGLSSIIITKGARGSYAFSFKNYDESDGLQGKAFNENAALKTKEGELIFGGANGFNVFRPSDIKINKTIPEVILTDFLIFNKSVKVNERINGRAMLDKAIGETKEITLKYNENIFSIEFAALNYIQPEKNKYMYMLEGFNKNWMKADGKIRKATYTNLNPGQYIFKVKASNNDDIWNEQGTQLIITILPPFWKTKTALILYILLIIGALLLSRTILLERARLNFKLEQERQEAHRSHELDMMKIKFFTNISHEFRTPLTLIITPLEKILKNAREPELKLHLDLIHRNAKRLLNLVNQLLDFRRMEVQELKLNPSRGDIISFIKDISYSFSDISEKKNILFTFRSEIRTLETFFDQDKLEKILFNLLSNAYKFTPEQGSVSVEIKIADQGRVLPELHNSKILEIKVKDTGIGIEPDKHEKIFERFFQNEVPGNLINMGSGIGLAITREFVKLHGGTITVDSESEKGSCFTIFLPLHNMSQPIDNVPTTEQIQDNTETYKAVNQIQQDVGEKNKKPVLLLIEDNEDFRFYLKDNLKDNYHVLDAANGLEGWRQILNHIPDLIVSDIMMPEVDGIELCKRIKNDPRTSHIPVILLTARHAEEQKLEGFQCGADDYITKPFNFEILEIRIKNMILHRDSLRKAFQKQIMINPSEISVTSLDEKLIQKAIDLVEKNIANPDFSVEELSRELAMSRVHLYKKLLSLTGKSPIEFIRVLRLKRAAQLLEKSQLSVSEIAYEVGFNNPKYFTKYFKTEFGVLPSQYQQQKTNE